MPTIVGETGHLIITWLGNGLVRVEDTAGGDKIIFHYRAIPQLIETLKFVQKSVK